MNKKSIHELRINLTDLVEKAKYGETVVITKSGKPQAKIVSLTENDLAELQKESYDNNTAE